MHYLPMALAALHALAATAWVGGLIFAYAVLRPASGALERPDRLRLWHASFRRFFILVWHAVVILPVTGYGMVATIYGGFGGTGAHVHLMQATGWIMIALFLYVFLGPWRRFGVAMNEQLWDVADAELARIRRIVRTNIVLGIVTIAAGASGWF